MRTQSLILVCILCVFPGSARAATAEWNRAQATLPNHVCPSWELLQRGTSTATLTAEGLTLSTSLSDHSEWIGYRQMAPMVDFSRPVVIEARVKFGTGTAAVGNRTAAAILFTLRENFGNALFIDRDRIFLQTQNNVVGPTALVDTDGAFHTYRIEVEPGGGIRVLYDGALVLAGTAFTSPESNGAGARVAFGELSSFAGGTSQWEYVRHDVLVAAQAPCLFGQAPTTEWTARSGMTPNEVCPAWELLDRGSPRGAILGGGKLAIETSASDLTQWLGYRQVEPLVSYAQPVVIEARMRLVSGRSSVAFRAPAHILYTLRGSLGNALFIGLDRLFLEDPIDVVGPSVSVDTDGAFHTYRIEVDTAGNARVLYDGVQVLAGQSFESPETHGMGARVAFGELSYATGGRSEWEYVRHNALSAIPRACVNHPPVAAAGADQTRECGTAVLLDGSASSDPDGDALTYEWREGQTLLGRGATLPLFLGAGEHEITLRVSDRASASSEDTIRIVVVDRQPPSITTPSATPSRIWPPNRKMIDVAVAYAATDACGPVTTSLSVTSSDPAAKKEPDWEIVDAHHARLRAERAPGAASRLYEITVHAADAAGNVSASSVTVVVAP